MNKIIPTFFVALGMILGASFFGSIGAILTNQPPLKIMSDTAEEIKLFAIIGAIGGTFTRLKILEGGFFEGEFIVIIQQLLILISSYFGAQLGYWLIIVISGGK